MFPKTASLLLVFAISASAATKNYLTGQLDFGTGTDYYHSFFAFNGLSGLTKPIVSTQASATLMIDGFSGNVATLDGVGTVSGKYHAPGRGKHKKWALPTIKTFEINHRPPMTRIDGLTRRLMFLASETAPGSSFRLRLLTTVPTVASISYRYPQFAATAGSLKETEEKEEE